MPAAPDLEQMAEEMRLARERWTQSIPEEQDAAYAVYRKLRKELNSARWVEHQRQHLSWHSGNE
jgi:hypothetical protein